MGRKNDPVVTEILEEARKLREKNAAKVEKFDTQSSIVEVKEPEVSECRSHAGKKKLIIKQQGLQLHQYSPLIPTRVYGRSDRVRMLNLTGPLRNHIAYSAGSNIVLFDYVKDQQLILPGHRNKIVALVKDRKNKFFASGDWGPRSTVIIWDVYTGNPFQALSLGDYHPNGVVSLDFAGHTPYIGLLGAEKYCKQLVSIWPFEVMKTQLKPTCYIQVPIKAGYQHEICFHPEKFEFFATTGHRGVCFYTLLRLEKRIICHVPKLPKVFLNRMKKFTHSIWNSENNCLLTATVAGFIVVWDIPSSIGLVEPPDPTKNVREFKRCYKIGSDALTCFIQYKDLYVMGDERGVVRFYDKHFRLLRWTKDHKLPPIYSVAFNDLSHQPAEFQRAMRERYDQQIRPHIHSEKHSFIRDFTMGMRYYRAPSETTIERHPFHCPDFFIGVAHGNIFYYHIAEERLDTVVHGANSRFVGCDVNQLSNHLALLTYKGEIHLYDTKTHRMVMRRRLFKKPTRVTCLKFHPSGTFAFIGSETGRIFYRRAFDFKPIDIPLDNSRSGIVNIIFSDDGLFMAHYDKSRAIALYVNLPRKASWVFKGKQRMHAKDIVEIMFYMDKTKNANRLFSLGADRRIIEYDIPNSSVSGGLKPLSVTKIEQFSFPLAMCVAEPFPSLKPHLLIANDAYKITVYDPDDRQIRRTCQGPVHGAPLNKLVRIKPEGRKPGARVFTLFIGHNKLGFIKPPLDGNPYKYLAVLAHPEGVGNVATTFDHKTIFSTGAIETACIQWRPNISAVENCAVKGGTGAKPFFQMLDREMPPGKSLVAEVQNCFYTLMLQKISSTKELLMSEMRIQVKEIPSVVRFCGYFPTEYEIDLMIEEAEFAGVADHGVRNEEITFEEFIKLFANHRRYPSHTRTTFAQAFRKICKIEKGEATMKGNKFKKLLTTRGEKINEIDLPVYLPVFFSSVVKQVPDSTLQLKAAKSKEKEVKKRIIKKEIIPNVKAKAFLDYAYSRNVPIPMKWEPENKDRSKMTSIVAHLAKHSSLTDAFPALGAANETTDN